MRHEQPCTSCRARIGDSRSVIGIIDGASAHAVESEDDKQSRSKVLRDLGYKR